MYVYIYIYIQQVYTYVYVYIYIYREREIDMYVHMHMYMRAAVRLTRFGTSLMGTELNGYLVLQGNIPLRTSHFKDILKLLARKRLGTRWAKYPVSRCREIWIKPFLRAIVGCSGMWCSRMWGFKIRCLKKKNIQIKRKNEKN